MKMHMHHPDNSLIIYRILHLLNNNNKDSNKCIINNLQDQEDLPKIINKDLNNLEDNNHAYLLIQGKDHHYLRHHHFLVALFRFLD